MNKKDITIIIVALIIAISGFFLYQNFTEDKTVGVLTYQYQDAKNYNCEEYCKMNNFRTGECASEGSTTPLGSTKDCKKVSPDGKSISTEKCYCSNYYDSQVISNYSRQYYELNPCVGKGEVYYSLLQQKDNTIKPIYRMYNPDTKDRVVVKEEEINPYKEQRGYRLVGKMGYIYSRPGEGRITAYRVYNGKNDYVVVTDNNLQSFPEYEGWEVKGIFGYFLEDGSFNEAVAVHHVYSKVNEDSTLVKSIGLEKFIANFDYIDIGVVGYILNEIPGAEEKNMCCPGLTPQNIFPNMRIDGNIIECGNPSLGVYVCTSCGNGIAEINLGENICNCPQDFSGYECDAACEEIGLEMSKCVPSLLQEGTTACSPTTEVGVGQKLCPSGYNMGSQEYVYDLTRYGDCCCKKPMQILDSCGDGNCNAGETYQTCPEDCEEPTSNLECDEDEFEISRKSWSSSGEDSGDTACCDDFDMCVYDEDCYDILDYVEFDDEDDERFICVLDPSEDYYITTTIDEGETEENTIYNLDVKIELIEVDSDDNEVVIKELYENKTFNLDEGDIEDLDSGATIELIKVYTDKAKFEISYEKPAWLRCDDENGDYCEDCGYTGYDEDEEECYGDGDVRDGPSQYDCDRDGICEPKHGEDEITCPEDCIFDEPEPTTYCGDGICSSTESTFSCPEDCGDGLADYEDCGDGFCSSDEDEYSCPEDCKGDGETCNLWLPLILIIVILLLGFAGYKYTKKKYVLYIASGLLLIGMIIDLIYNCYWWLWLIAFILFFSGSWYYCKKNQDEPVKKSFKKKTTKQPVKKLNPNQIKVLKEYVLKTRKQGFKDEQIRKSLSVKGWPKKDIDLILGNNKK